MSRVNWRKAADHFNFKQAANGRLCHDVGTSAAMPMPWAVCGSRQFVERAVPAMRSAGLDVVALSVMPKNLFNVSARLQAQDTSDVLCRSMNVPQGLSIEAFGAQDYFEHVLLEISLPDAVMQSLKSSGKAIAAIDDPDAHAVNTLRKTLLLAAASQSLGANLNNI